MVRFGAKGIGRPPSAKAKVGPRALAYSHAQRSRSIALGPLGRLHPAQRLAATSRHRVWCRGSGFGLSDCPWHVTPPRGMPSTRLAPPSLNRPPKATPRLTRGAAVHPLSLITAPAHRVALAHPHKPDRLWAGGRCHGRDRANTQRSRAALRSACPGPGCPQETGPPNR